MMHIMGVMYPSFYPEAPGRRRHQVRERLSGWAPFQRARPREAERKREESIKSKAFFAYDIRHAKYQNMKK